MPRRLCEVEKDKKVEKKKAYSWKLSSITPSPDQPKLHFTCKQYKIRQARCHPTNYVINTDKLKVVSNKDFINFVFEDLHLIVFADACCFEKNKWLNDRLNFERPHFLVPDKFLSIVEEMPAMVGHKLNIFKYF